MVGYADVSDLSCEAMASLKNAVSIAVALDPSVILEISKGPTKRYYKEYNRANKLLADLCDHAVNILISQGYKAVALEPTTEQVDRKSLDTPLPHKTAATKAGLGWIGKSALLVTKEYGPAVRLATVLTNAEFEVANPVNDSYCGECNKCVESCPAKAISGRNWELGLEREAIYDAFACYGTARKLSKKISLPSTLVICGICINVCPWTQKYISRELKD